MSWFLLHHDNYVIKEKNNIQAGRQKRMPPLMLRQHTYTAERYGQFEDNVLNIDSTENLKMLR